MKTSDSQLMVYNRDGESYALMYLRDDPHAALRSIKRWVLDPDLPFSLHDGVRLGKQVIFLAVLDGIEINTEAF